MSLIGACGRGDTLAAIALIDRGASVNEKVQFGQTPLHLACNSGHTATAVALIERGASVNEKDQDGQTPLCYACLFSHSATAIVLLENGAVGLMHGHTPSYRACTSCTADVILLMIRQGAILTAADLKRFRNQRTVTDEQACTVEVAYKREDNWRRRAHYAMFLSSIRDLMDVEHEPGPSAPASGGGVEMGNESIEAKHARLMRAVDKVLCRTNTQRLICSFL
jgi:hypothetical protein